MSLSLSKEEKSSVEQTNQKNKNGYNGQGNMLSREVFDGCIREP